MAITHNHTCSIRVSNNIRTLVSKTIPPIINEPPPAEYNFQDELTDTLDLNQWQVAQRNAYYDARLAVGSNGWGIHSTDEFDIEVTIYKTSLNNTNQQRECYLAVSRKEGSVYYVYKVGWELYDGTEKLYWRVGSDVAFGFDYTWEDYQLAPYPFYENYPSHQGDDTDSFPFWDGRVRLSKSGQQFAGHYHTVTNRWEQIGTAITYNDLADEKLGVSMNFHKFDTPRIDGKYAEIVNEKLQLRMGETSDPNYITCAFSNITVQGNIIDYPE